MPKKESGAQGRKRRAQLEAFLDESRKFMKKYVTSSGSAERLSADIRRRDESADTDNQRILKHRGRRILWLGHWYQVRFSSNMNNQLQIEC